MSNGPMGGFMPTPPAPSQPPPVKLDTTALSRGNFNNFLKSMNGASALTPLAPSGMGAMMPQVAPSLTSDIDIFNEPVQMMHQGGTAGNPLDSYGDFLSNQISNTQVEPFIQEVQQMASQRFNLDNSGGLPQLMPFNPPQDLSRPKMEVAEPLLQPTLFQPPPMQAEMGQPIRDKDGILREPMGLRGGPELFKTLDQQIFNDGFMPGSEQLLGGLPRTFFNGGEVDDFGDVPGDTSDPSIGDTEDRSESDSFQDALDSIDLGSSDDSMFSDDPSSATPMGLSMPSAQNFGSRITTNPISGFDTNTINQLKAEINSRNEIALSEEDNFYEGDKLTPAGQTELSNRNAADLNAVISGEIPASSFISAGSASDILGDKDIQDALSLDKNIDVFENIINRDFTRSLPGANLPPTIGSNRSTVAQDQARALANLVPAKDTTVSDSLQQNVKEQQEALAAQRGRALGPITFGDDLANFQERLEPFDSSRVGDDFDTALDIVDRREKDQAIQNLLDAGQRAQDIKNIQGALDRDILSQTLDQTTPTTTTSTRPEDFEEQVGLPFSDQRMRDIERLYNLPEGQRRAGEGDDPNFFAGIPSAFNVFETIPREQMAIDVALGRPRGLGEMFRGVTAPNLQTETMKQFTDRLQRNIIGPEGDTTSFSAKNIPESQLIRDNRGRITAITDASGRTITGVNPDEPIGGGDDSDPIIKPLIIPKEEEEDKPPNVIGGIDIRPKDPLPLVVDSPFAPATSKIEPISFDSGQLNKLIELLTGVPAKPVVSAAEGGLIRAVDDFLAIGR